MASWNRVLLLLAVVFAAIAFLLNYLTHSLAAVLYLDSWLDYWQGSKDFNLKQNIYLQGNYSPVEDESRDVNVKVISGALPENLEGIFIRIGPNPIVGHGLMKRYHWFDGHGNFYSNNK